MFAFILNGSAQVELIDFRYTRSMRKRNAYIATPLDHNFSFSMVVARSQTKHAISKAKCAIGLKLADGLALG